MGRITGIGGVFFKTDDPQAQSQWYAKHLGLAVEPWGGSAFTWRERADADEIGYTVWCPFPRDADKFDPSGSPFMVNYRVEDLPGLLKDLAAAGVEIVGEMESHENGRFAWILDPEGNKIELWEPVPSASDPYLPGE